MKRERPSLNDLWKTSRYIHHVSMSHLLYLPQAACLVV